MKSCLLVTGVLSLGLVTTASAPAFAHHGNAAYADEITEFKQATVTKFAWANPHALITTQRMRRATSSIWSSRRGPQALRLIGWAKTSLAPGDVITVRMPSPRTATAGRLQKIILADGSELRDTQLGGDAPKTRFDPEAGK